MVPWFEHGKIYLPNLLAYVDTTGAHKDLIKEFIDTEYASFPVGRHDDMLDALARLAEPKLKLPFPSRAEKQTHIKDFGVMDPEVGY